MTNQKKTSPRYSPEVQARAARMGFDRVGEYMLRWAAIESIAAKIGCAAQTLATWVTPAQRDRSLKPTRQRVVG